MPRELLQAFADYLYAELRYTKQSNLAGYSIDRKAVYLERTAELLNAVLTVLDQEAPREPTCQPLRAESPKL